MNGYAFTNISDFTDFNIPESQIDSETTTSEVINDGSSEGPGGTNTEIDSNTIESAEVTDPGTIVIDSVQYDELMSKIDNLLTIQVDALSLIQFYSIVLVPLICVVVLLWWFARQFFG